VQRKRERYAAVLPKLREILGLSDQSNKWAHGFSSRRENRRNGKGKSRGDLLDESQKVSQKKKATCASYETGSDESRKIDKSNRGRLSHIQRGEIYEERKGRRYSWTLHQKKRSEDSG